MAKKKPTCKDCAFYKPINKSQGDCFGHAVPAETPVEQCPTKSFKPRR